MPRGKSPNYVTFSTRETIVTLKEDRGELRTNDMGDFFLRNLIVDGAEKFTCCNPDLERQLIDLGAVAGMTIGISRLQQGRAAIWKVRRIGGTIAQIPHHHRSYAHNGTAKPTPIPESKYARLDDAPLPTWDDETNEPAPQQGVPHLSAASLVPPESPDSLLGRCLCEALDACKIAQEHAAKIGLPVVFGPDQIEAMGVSIFIARTRDGAVVERVMRKPAGQVNGSTHLNGGTSWSH